jgi:hypothetical protein
LPWKPLFMSQANFLPFPFGVIVLHSSYKKGLLLTFKLKKIS